MKSSQAFALNIPCNPGNLHDMPMSTCHMIAVVPGDIYWKSETINDKVDQNIIFQWETFPLGSEKAHRDRHITYFPGNWCGQVSAPASQQHIQASCF